MGFRAFFCMDIIDLDRSHYLLSFLILFSPFSFHTPNNFPFPYEIKHALSAFCETGLFYLK